MPKPRADPLTALEEFVSTIDATGGITTDDHGHPCPIGDEEWIDLGYAYLTAIDAIDAANRHATANPILEQTNPHFVAPDDTDTVSRNPSLPEAAVLQTASRPTETHHHYIFLDDLNTYSALHGTSVLAIDPDKLTPAQLAHYVDGEQIPEILDQAIRSGGSNATVLDLHPLLDLYYLIAELPNSTLPEAILNAHAMVNLSIGCVDHLRHQHPTTLQAFLHGHHLASWPCDTNPADGSVEPNGGIEHHLEYADRIYQVITSWDGTEIYQPSQLATRVSDDTQPPPPQEEQIND